MAFYRPDSAMQAQLAGLLDRLSADNRPGLHNSVAISWVRYDRSDPIPGSGLGAGWSDQRGFFPASVVKLFYALAAEEWLQQDLLPEGEELRRAMRDMIADSSNDAT
ncbi:MAG TPA: hypothetical protein QF784_05760, partial [Prochlorococcaceae cyanobacterium Fu_MAG_134]|nr:hypothetical protein [Prochlorococcaceae cyanobacterium Fu_MAG_134]